MTIKRYKEGVDFLEVWLPKSIVIDAIKEHFDSFFNHIAVFWCISNNGKQLNVFVGDSLETMETIKFLFCFEIDDPEYGDLIKIKQDKPLNILLDF